MNKTYLVLAALLGTALIATGCTSTDEAPAVITPTTETDTVMEKDGDAMEKDDSMNDEENETVEQPGLGEETESSVTVEDEDYEGETEVEDIGETPVDKEAMMEAVSEDSFAMELDTATAETMSEIEYDFSGELESITSDAGTGDESGTAMATFTDEGEYKLYVEFDGLPELDAEEFFYEGWVVRRGDDFNVISTGPVETLADGTIVNIYASEDDLTDHDFYVLTLEPNDNDPAPAAHVLEGTMVQ